MTLIKRWLWSKVTLIKRWLSSKVVFDQIYHFDEYIFFVFCFKLSKNFSASALRASAPCVRVVSNKSVLSGIFPKIHVRVNTIIRYIRVSCKVDVNSYWPLLTFCRLMVLCTTKIPLYSECCRVPGFVYWSSNTWVNLTFLRFPLTCRRSLAKTVANLGCNLSLSCRQ